jgi:tRNA(Ile)-lysidine synthase
VADTSTDTPLDNASSPLEDKECVALFAPLTTYSKAIIAVSGGCDSLALLVTLAQWQKHHAPSLALEVVCVDHGLREEAKNECAHVQTIAAREGLPFQLVTITTLAPSSGLQEWARKQRYQAFTAHACSTGATFILTAHTQDDQAETLLMRLSAGSGLAGLAGMQTLTLLDQPLSAPKGTPHHSVVLFRPFLSVPKSRLMATCYATNTPFIHDPSNSDPRFSRTRWRTLMPMLAQEGMTVKRLSVFAQRARKAEEALHFSAQHLVEAAATGLSTHWMIKDWSTKPFAIVCRALALLLNQDSSHTHISLEHLERATTALMRACEAQQPYQQTLAGCVLTLNKTGIFTLIKEPPRQRGRKMTSNTF